MANNNTATHGNRSTNGNILYLENALIEEISTNDGRNGYVLVSYGVKTADQMIKMESLKLIVGRNTVIMNEFAETLRLCDLEVGMYIDASFSAAMTMSIPPQSRAFQIIARSKAPAVVVTTDRVVSVDVRNSFLFTGNPYEMADQMRFVVSSATVILDWNGNRISLSQLKPGQLVRVEHAAFQTMSIPPQTTAFRIQVLSVD
jgi:hypothetical protein